MSDSSPEKKPLSETITRTRVKQYTMDPKSVGCYASKAEVDEAIKNGTFNMNKCQYYDRKRKRQFFLVYR